MDGSTGRRIPPIIMGHEASGVIVETGKNVSGWKIGDRVTFDSTIYKLDDWYTCNGHYNLSDNRMVLGVSCNDFRRMNFLMASMKYMEWVHFNFSINISRRQTKIIIDIKKGVLV